MFRHQKEFEAKPEKPNPLVAEIPSRINRWTIWRDECCHAILIPRMELPWEENTKTC